MRGLYFVKGNTSSTKKQEVEVYKELTSAYLSYLRGAVRSSRMDSCAPSAIRLLCTDTDSCMELYRHSLCECLGLNSTLAYSELAPLVHSCSMVLDDIVKANHLKEKSEEFRRGMLEACMHCIVMSRNKARGY